MKKNNIGCLIWVLIILAIVGVAWVRYLIPIAVILIVIAVVNGKKNKTHSSRDEERENQEQSYKTSDDETAQSQRRDDIITCEYCGCRIDTSRYNTCPHCGGPYSDNEQWKERNDQ